jgi:hypothetical protein
MLDISLQKGKVQKHSQKTNIKLVMCKHLLLSHLNKDLYVLRENIFLD